MPRKGKQSRSGNCKPRQAAAATPSGMMPSPQALSMGGLRASATVTVKPLQRAASAAARPTGPPPITKTSHFGNVTVSKPAFPDFYFEALVVVAVSVFLRVVTGDGSRDPTGPVNSSLEPS